MKLLVGLGNPGAKYARNRHNVGWMALDAIAQAHGFALWRAKFQGQIAEGRIGGDRAILLKPETFMNLSGDSVRAAMAFHKLDPSEVIVLHDELDLAPGRVRARVGGGAAGHNGVRSIAAHIGPEFLRVRIGIGHPGDKRVVANYVLNDFARDEAAWLDPVLAAIAKAAPDLVARDLARFSNAVALAAPAPDPKPEPKPKAAPGPSEARTKPDPVPAKPAPEAAAEEPPAPASALRRLVERFR
ncbi:aminoacyl-tRNA hydrolase [Amaricoccus sp.]|uniref:aminoacyl-tRNA hydrolase n=1 Tax=Amaricoccus sp. TaxID=1872485 RepID=UPI001B42429A|nr:aminoacyl-tRNA hydrolase [Amaricoccus sp.]MBP7000006.1 aminoacyl-tRNA hydrolase [Amaricoccus sp.]